MTRHQRIGGELSSLCIPVWVHEERLGLTYLDEIEVYNVPVSGWSSHTPATYMDPPESDGEVAIDLMPEELWNLVEETDDGMLREAGLTLIEDPQSLFDGAVEVAAERVWHDHDRYAYDDEPNQHDDL